MSEIAKLQQSMRALLLECEERLTVVEQGIARQSEQPVPDVEAGNRDKTVVDYSESDQVTEPAKSQASATAADSAVQEATNRNRAKNRAANQAALQLLFETYPEVFSREAVRPLKIGIQEDLIADEKLARNRIKRALASYVRNPQYLRSLQAGAERIGLDGQGAGVVSEEEAAHALEKLKALKAERRERQKSARDQARKQEENAREQRLSNKLDQLVKLNSRSH